MQIDILTDPSCFQSLETEWLQLLSNSVINHIFITPQFQKSWWQTLGQGELQVVTARDEQGGLKGILPCFRFLNERREQQLSFVGCVNVSDYLDMIVDREHQAEVYAAFCEVLKTQLEWDCLFFCSIPHTSATPGILQTFAQHQHWQFQQIQQDVCPVLLLPKTWEEYLSQIGKKQRHEVKRKWQKLETETGASFELVEAPSELPTAVNDFIALHQKSSAEKKNFWDDRHVTFFQKFAQQTGEQGWLKLYFLSIDGKRVAAMLGFEYNQQFFLYNSGFDADEYKQLSVGNVLTAYTIQRAILRGNSKYDFLRGDEEYKFRFGAVAEPVFDITIRRE